MQNHPVDPEAVAKLSESRGEKGLLHRHEHFAFGGKRGKEALGFGIALGVQCEIRAAHGFRIWDVGTGNLRASDRNSRMEDRVLRLARARCRILAMSHHHAYLPSEMV